MPSREIKSLDQVMNGAVNERFQAELSKVWQNIFDPNTNPEQKRSVTLTFTFKPNQNRDAASMSFNVSSKVAAPIPVQQTVLMYQRDDGSVIVTERTEQIPGQLDIEGHEQRVPRVVEFSPPHLEAN